MRGKTIHHSQTSTNGPTVPLGSMKVIPIQGIPDDTIMVSPWVYEKVSGLKFEDFMAEVEKRLREKYGPEEAK